MAGADLAGEAKRLIDAIAARPRFAGSAEESSARRLCAGMLEGAGLSTRELPFEFSEWPGRWGIPAIAAGTLLGTLITAAASLRNPTLGRLTLSLSLVLGYRIVHSRRKTATRTMGRLRRRSLNLEAARGDAPRVWLVAHLDSKSQSIPMLARVTAHVALSLVVLSTSAAVMIDAWSSAPRSIWYLAAIAGAVAAFPLLACRVGNNSQGALDNATGVAAVLLAARLVPPEKAFGVLITSGEELDLAGAREWSARSPKGAAMINCDTVDDEGSWRCMWVNRPHALGVAAENAAKKLGLALRMGKVIPGIITDSMAFEAAGLQTVTLSRGTLRTLARLHTRGDSPDRVTGSGAAAAALMLAQMVEELA